jgi:hypothetical protein
MLLLDDGTPTHNILAATNLVKASHPVWFDWFLRPQQTDRSPATQVFLDWFVQPRVVPMMVYRMRRDPVVKRLVPQQM